MEQYTFKPTKDMTVTELSVIMQTLMVALIQAMSGQTVTGHEDLEIEEPVYDNLPSEVKKHFKLKRKPEGRTISPLSPPRKGKFKT